MTTLGLLKSRLAPPILFSVLCLSGWEVAARVGDIPSYILPPPSAVVTSLILHGQMLVREASATLVESLLGLLLGFLMAVPSAVLLVESGLAKRSIGPYLGVLQALPLIAVAPIIVLWFGTGIAGRIVMASLVAVFPLVMGLMTGLNSSEPDERVLLQLLTARSRHRYRYFLVPRALPHFLTSLKTALTLSLVGAIVAEFLIPVAGLGKILVLASYSFDTSLMFATVITSSLIAIVYLVIVNLLEKRLAYWHPSVRLASLHSIASDRGNQ